MRRVLCIGLFALAMASAAPLQAQVPRPLAPMNPEKARVAPFFDGWYANPDGTVTLSFGFSNQFKRTVEIPIGPDNVVTPKEFDGRQPTVFPVPAPDSIGVGGATAGVASVQTGDAAAKKPAPRPTITNNYERERGAFTVTVPANYAGDVVWTLRYQGQVFSVPARAKAAAYQLSWPMAMGSTPPLVRFAQGGPSGRGPSGIQTPVQAKVGVPVPLRLVVHDDAVHEKEPVPVKRDLVPSMNITWFVHAGPVSSVTFAPARTSVKESQGTVETTATFSTPGEYTVRARVDTFGNIDSASADQCCWTNAYWKVTVR
ncbi:MAG: hypothetical protein AB7H96_20870 [Vicinamibacterales bacterium]